MKDSLEIQKKCIRYYWLSSKVEAKAFVFTFSRQKQSSIGVLRKRCSENVQQIYRRSPMPKCHFNKVAKPGWGFFETGHIRKLH